MEHDIPPNDFETSLRGQYNPLETALESQDGDKSELDFMARLESRRDQARASTHFARNDADLALALFDQADTEAASESGKMTLINQINKSQFASFHVGNEERGGDEMKVSQRFNDFEDSPDEDEDLKDLVENNITQTVLFGSNNFGLQEAGGAPRLADKSPPARSQPMPQESRKTSSSCGEVLVAVLPEEDELHAMIGPVENPSVLSLDGNEADAGLSRPKTQKRALEGRQPDLARAAPSDGNQLGLLDQSIKMLCDTHKAPAVFFSQKEERYVCFKCLINNEKLQYIDKSYNREMEDFERIKQITSEACKVHQKNLNITKKWKYDVRKCLMRIKTRFNDNIDKFINEFASLFRDVDQSNDIRPLQGEDKRIHALLEELQRKYVEILKIFTTISSSQANKRIQYIDTYKTYMKNIEKKVLENDQLIKKKSTHLREVLDRTVALDSFESKIESKLIKFMNKECKKKWNNMAMSRLDDTQAIFNDYQYNHKPMESRGIKSSHRPTEA